MEINIKLLTAFAFVVAIFSFFTGMYLHLTESTISTEPLWISLVVSTICLLFWEVLAD